LHPWGRLLAELKRRKQRSYVSAAAFVKAYLGLGEYDLPFLWLEEASELGRKGGLSKKRTSIDFVEDWHQN
jgi:hypothetical protein